MNRTERLKVLAVLLLEALLALVVLTLVTWHAHAQPAIALATDKQTYTLGETVVFFGRGYDFPHGLVTFYIYLDEITEDEQIRSVIYGNFTAEPPNWDFTIFWAPQKPGHFSAYVTGPDHTASAEVQFQVVDEVPVPEFASTLEGVLLSALVTAFAAIAIRRSHR